MFRANVIVLGHLCEEEMKVSLVVCLVTELCPNMCCHSMWSWPEVITIQHTHWLDKRHNQVLLVQKERCMPFLLLAVQHNTLHEVS